MFTRSIKPSIAPRTKAAQEPGRTSALLSKSQGPWLLWVTRIVATDPPDFSLMGATRTVYLASGIRVAARTETRNVHLLYQAIYRSALRWRRESSPVCSIHQSQQFRNDPGCSSILGSDLVAV